MDKRVFDDAIGEVPPSTIDVDAVITRGRRADRVRRVANPAVAAGVAVVLAVGVIAFTLTRGGDDGGVRVGGSAGTSATAPPSSEPGKAPKGTLPDACSRPDLETPAAAVARLTPLLKTLFHTPLPDAQFVANPVNEYPAGVLRGPLELFQVTGQTHVDRPVCDVDSYFLTRATVRSAAGDGNVMLMIAPAVHGAREAMLECDPPGSGEQTYCDVVTASNGDHILKQTRALEGGTTMNRAEIVRADGTSVIIESANIGSDVKTGGAPTTPTPPLTVDQLVAIGTDPGMTLFP
jgi:hypothetical protein